MNRRATPLVAFLLGALAMGALGMAVHDDATVRVTRAFVTAHIGDTLTNRVTTSVDSVSVSLARPPGYPSRIWLPRCGSTRKFSRDWIGTRVVAAETTFVTVTGTMTECANPPPITVPCWPTGMRTDSTAYAKYNTSGDTTVDPSLVWKPCT